MSEPKIVAVFTKRTDYRLLFQ